MHFTLHLTNSCNMNCRYCYSPPCDDLEMSSETARKAVEYAARLDPLNAGIIFFGGEPLLKKELIKQTIAHCQSLEQSGRGRFHYKVTTNGLLLDSDFLDYADSVHLNIALSLDGIREAHDCHRIDRAGKPTFDKISAKIPQLLKHQPYANLMMTVSPETMHYYYDSVEYLLNNGFKYLIVSLNYAGNWTDSHLKELRRQYILLADLYKRLTLSENKFYFSPFEIKLSSHIKGEEAHCNRCILGKRQVSVGPDGTIYPCVQFVQDGKSNTRFAIGDIENGIDRRRQEQLYRESLKVDDACRECALRGRCNNDCSCLNWQTTSRINKVSPILCETERILIPIVDRLGEDLYRRNSTMFIQKHYNAAYPYLSMLEDTLN